MAYIVPGRGTGASSATSPRAQERSSAVAAAASDSTSGTVAPPASACTRPSDTNPPSGRALSGGRKVARRIPPGTLYRDWMRRRDTRRHVRDRTPEGAGLGDHVEPQPARDAERQRRDDDLVVAVAVYGVLDRHQRFGHSDRPGHLMAGGLAELGERLGEYPLGLLPP